MLILVVSALAQDPLPTASGPLLLPLRTTNLSRGEAVAVDALFRAHLELAAGSPLYPAEATRELVLRTGDLADPLAQCRAVACPRVWTIEVVHLGDSFHVEAIDRDPDGRVRLDLSAASRDLDGLAQLAQDLGVALTRGAATGPWLAAMPITTLAGVEPDPPNPVRGPHETTTYGPLLGALVVSDTVEVIPAGRVGFDMRIERESWYLHGASTISINSLSDAEMAGLDVAYGGGWNGEGERVNPFFGGGVGAGIYAFDDVAPNVFGFCEGGVAFLRNSSSRVYLTGRVAGTFDTVDEQFRLIAGLDAVAGF